VSVSPWIATLQDGLSFTRPSYFTLKQSTLSTTTAGAGPQLSAAVALKATGASCLLIATGALQLMDGAVVSRTFTLTDEVSVAKRLSATRRWYVVSPGG